MTRYLASMAMVLALLFSPAAANGGDEPRKPHNECQEGSKNHVDPLTHEQVEIYVNIIKKSFDDNPKHYIKDRC